ncbi:MAG: 1-acyl-sn-glycerol-3-phosphate acyltransferase [Chlamydiae bacterium]|nr:1-acyl-sn-glycerol-3-phosphate acyltransferase [Chlamydiota bacterium]
MMYFLCSSIVWLYAKIFYRHKVYGKSHVPKGGGIITPNHTSFLDPPLVGISCPTKIHFLARDTLFQKRFLGWLIPKLNSHPVKRQKGNVQAMRTVIDLVGKEEKVLIFPEGRRSPDGKFLSGQLGVGMLVQRTGCNVIPVYIHGTHAVWPVGKKFFKLFGKTAAVFGSPLTFSQVSVEDKKAAQAQIVETIMDRIKELKAWYLNGAKGTPP